MMPAPTCTVGPSRPIESPASNPPDTSSTLCTDTRSDTNQERCAVSRSSSSARTPCGMPEPMVLGAQRRVHHSTPTVSAGVHSKAR